MRHHSYSLQTLVQFLPSGEKSDRHEMGAGLPRACRSVMAGYVTVFACCGKLKLLVLVLGMYLVTSESKDASVECYASDATATALDDELASCT